MQELIIQAASRTETGSSPCRRMRHKGLVPGVVYGHGQLRNVSLNFRDFNHLLHSMHAEHAVVKCTIDTDDVHVLIKAVQRNGVTHNIAHVDLMIVDLDEIVIVAVPVATLVAELYPSVNCSSSVTLKMPRTSTSPVIRTNPVNVDPDPGVYVNVIPAIAVTPPLATPRSRPRWPSKSSEAVSDFSDFNPTLTRT